MCGSGQYGERVHWDPSEGEVITKIVRFLTKKRSGEDVAVKKISA